MHETFLVLNDVFNSLLSFSREGAIFVFDSIGSTDASVRDSR